MKKLNPGLHVFFALLGAGIGFAMSHYYGTKVVLICLTILFVFLIGLAQWHKHKNKPKKPN